MEYPKHINPKICNNNCHNTSNMNLTIFPKFFYRKKEYFKDFIVNNNKIYNNDHNN